MATLMLPPPDSQPRNVPAYDPSFYLPTASADELLGLDPPPAYEPDFKEASRQWKAACNAASQLEEIGPILKNEGHELETAKRELEILKKKSAGCFATLHEKQRAGRLSKVIRRVQSKARVNFGVSLPSSSRASQVEGQGEEEREDRSSASSVIMDEREIAVMEFEKAHTAEMRQAARVAELEDSVTSTRRKRDILLSKSAVKEDAWALLQCIASELTPPSWLASELGEAVEALHTAESAFDLAAQRARDMRRARQTIQHSHHYLTKCLSICDDLNINKERGAKFGMFSGFTGFGRISDYQDAVRLASPAQICLNECIRVLSPYIDTLPENVLNDYKALEEHGVLQMAKIYNLVFGGRMIDTGVGRQIRYMLDKQDQAFTHLTQLAVWIQNEVPVSEATEKRAAAARDSARARLAALWTEAAEHS